MGHRASAMALEANGNPWPESTPASTSVAVEISSAVVASTTPIITSATTVVATIKMPAVNGTLVETAAAELVAIANAYSDGCPIAAIVVAASVVAATIKSTATALGLNLGRSHEHHRANGQQ